MRPVLTETSKEWTYGPEHERSIPPFDPVKAEHFWAVVVVYEWDPHSRRNILDSSTIRQVSHPYCQYCEQDFRESLKYSACPGEPVD